jgi:glyoxalase family protein
VPVGHKGSGHVHVTSFSVPIGSSEFWRERLSEMGVPAIERPLRFGDEVIEFPDPSGLIFELVFNERDVRQPWTTDEVGSSEAIRGLHGVTLLVRDAAPTIEFMTRVLGFHVMNESHGRFRLAVRDGVPGTTMDVVADASADAARNGLGTVHHVAMAIPTPADQLSARAELAGLGYRVTEVMDRQYFQSIYFREPGGVLFEIATMQPGFTDDEDVAELGRSLKLPRWEEPNRREIEAILPPVTTGS